MRSVRLALMVVVMACGVGAAQQPPDLNKILADIRAKDKGQLAISEEDGRFLRKIQGTFDFVFLDAWKRDYKKFFELVYPRLDKGGLFTAHNVVNKRGEMVDFLDAIQRNPSLWTAIVSPSGEGISLSYKR